MCKNSQIYTCNLEKKVDIEKKENLTWEKKEKKQKPREPPIPPGVSDQIPGALDRPRRRASGHETNQQQDG